METVPYNSYKNHSGLNRYNFRTVQAIDFLFSTLHTTPFIYGKTRFGVLHVLRARIATSDTPQGMNPSYLSAGVIKSLQIRFVGRGPIAIDLFCSLIFTLSVAEIQVCNVNAHFNLPRQP